MIGGLLKSTSSLAILAAAGLLIGGVALNPKAARAADLGGDCCADLEERVANLEATTVTKGNRKVSLEISGRMAATVTYFSDNSGLATNAGNGAAPVTTDSNHDLYITDNTGNGPNLVFDGSGKINSDLTAGFHMELDFDLSGTASQNTRNGANAIASSDTFVYLQSKQLGKLQLGHMNSALDDWDAQGFATGYVVSSVAPRAINGFFLRDSTGASSAITYNMLWGGGLDSASDNGIKYISPTFGNWLTFEAGYSGDDTWYGGAKIAGDITKTFHVKLAAAYQSAGDGDGLNGGTAATLGHQARVNQNGTANLLNVSGGIGEDTSGLFIQGAYDVAYASGPAPGTFVIPPIAAVAGPNPAAAPAVAGQGSALTHLQDMTDWEVLGGWHKNVTGMGLTEIWGSYAKANNVYADNTSMHFWQLGIDQAIDSAASHVFLTYENYSADSINVSDLNTTVVPNTGGTVGTQDLSTITAGMSVQF